MTSPGRAYFRSRYGAHRAVVLSAFREETEDGQALTSRILVIHGTSNAELEGPSVVVEPKTANGEQLGLTQRTYFYPGDACWVWGDELERKSPIGTVSLRLVARLRQMVLESSVRPTECGGQGEPPRTRTEIEQNAGGG
ncbi:MAG: hypothetical protein H6747_09005 [Deltaproteobacteria bacterium]|nr:hypothetical protein [Deltaproteobacteria bacterium]